MISGSRTLPGLWMWFAFRDLKTSRLSSSPIRSISERISTQDPQSGNILDFRKGVR